MSSASVKQRFGRGDRSRQRPRSRYCAGPCRDELPGVWNGPFGGKRSPTSSRPSNGTVTLTVCDMTDEAAVKSGLARSRVGLKGSIC